MAPFLGALAGAFAYDAFMFVGVESVINTPDAAAVAQEQRDVRGKFPQAAEGMV